MCAPLAKLRRMVREAEFNKFLDVCETYGHRGGSIRKLLRQRRIKCGGHAYGIMAELAAVNNVAAQWAINYLKKTHI